MPVSYNFPLRLDDDLREKLRYIAEKNSRSLNKEIEFLVKKHVEAYEKEHGAIAVKLSETPKCVRCWNHNEHVGEDHDHPELCPRCAQVVRTEA